MVNINDLQESLERESFIEEPEQTIGGKIGDILRNFNTGLARTLGIPRAITDLNEQLGGTIFGNVRTGERKEPSFNILPTGEQLQELGAKADITFPPGEEPDTLIARTIQNVGAAAPILPLLPLTAPIIAGEALAAFGAAAGGKFLESTDFGKKHPELARGIGELGGGITGVFTIPIARFLARGGSFGTVLRFIKRIIPSTEKRVTKRLQDIELTPETALKELEKMEKIPEGEFLLPGQAAGTPGIARLTKTVEEEIPKVAAIIEKRRINAVNQLQKQFNKTGDIGDARALLEEKLALRADQATKTLSKIDKVSDPTTLSTTTERILGRAEGEGRETINGLWRKLPSGVKVRGNNLNRVMVEELGNITEGGSINQISAVARQKLGRLNKEGKLVGGSLFSESRGKAKTILFDAQGHPIERIAKGKIEAEAKAVHQFYSLLGFEKERLGRIGGQGNKIRIINKLRGAALDDLDDVAVGGNYRETLRLTREFHNTFTRGVVGRILGRARGETPSPVTALEDIMGQGGVTAKENIQQALRASPKVKSQIEDFLKTQFAVIAKNDINNRINTTAGNAFIKKFGNILDDIFPELKRDFKDAITKQMDVDKFIGVPQVTGLSPLAREKTAAGFFLGKDPGEEMSALLRSRNVQRTSFLTDLVRVTKADPTGKALKGLQNGFTEELLKVGNIDEITRLSGTKIINRLKELKQSTLRSGLFNKEEFDRLERIGQVFRKIEIELKAKALKGGIINDPLGMLVALPGRFVGARIGGRAGQDIGSSLVLAGAGSKATTDFLKRFTNDEAREILIRFVLDKKLAKDLLTKVARLTEPQKGKLFKSILDRLEQIGLKIGRRIKENIPPPPVTGIAPAAGSFAAGISGERDPEDEELTRRLEGLLTQ